MSVPGCVIPPPGCPGSLLNIGKFCLTDQTDFVQYFGLVCECKQSGEEKEGERGKEEGGKSGKSGKQAGSEGEGVGTRRTNTQRRLTMCACDAPPQSADSIIAAAVVP